MSRWSRPILRSAHLEGLRMTNGETVPLTWKQVFMTSNKCVASAVANSLRNSDGSVMPALTASLHRDEHVE